MKQTLFDIGADALALYQLLEEMDGDISDPVNAAIVDEFFAENEKNLHTKVDGYGMLIREYEMYLTGLKAEAARMARNAAIEANKIDALKDRLKYFMESTGQTRIKTDRNNFTVANNGGKQPLKITCSADELPEDFRLEEIVYKPLTETIREAIERGETLPFAHLEPRGTHLRIS